MVAGQRLAMVPRSAGCHEVGLALAGELDAFSVRDLVAEVETLRRNGHLRVRLDLTGLTFVDSASLQALVEQAELLRGQGGQLVVERAAAPVVQRVLDVAGLDPGVDGFTVA